MQREAKATHPEMLHQSLALWVTGMMGDAVNALILNLNDRCTLGEMTFTDFRDGVNNGINFN
jgi:hypothetical protein